MVDTEARIDRAVLVAAAWAAIRGSQADRIRLSVVCATAGARQAEAGRSLAALLRELDDLEGLLLDKLSESAGAIAAPSLSELLSGARQMHDCCVRMRAAASVGFARAAGAAARKRARTARHDIVNNIGTVRNAILLMDDEPDDAAREHFRAIAKRNSIASEQLVRTHLSDDAACDGAQAASSTDAERIVAAELTTCADLGFSDEALRALRELACLAGVALSGDELSGALNVGPAKSTRNQRNDLGRASQGDNADTLGL